MEDFLGRDINVGFSGGEIKRAELLQLMLQDPEMILLDEPGSGVDLENVALIGEQINRVLGRHIKPNGDKTMKDLYRESSKSGLIITHTGHILNYLDVDIGHVLMDGSFTCQANPGEMLHTITEFGFDECYRCFRKGEIDDSI